MKRLDGVTIFALLLCVCPLLTACSPQSMAAETPPHSADSSSPSWPSHEEIEIILVKQYNLDLGTEAKNDTQSFSREEVQRVKDLVRARLIAEGIDKYKPSVRLVDTPGEIMVIFIGLFDDRVLPNGELLNREYHIDDGKLIRVIKRYPGGRTVTIRTEFTDEEIEQAAAVAAAHIRETLGWGDEEFEVVPYEYANRSENESHLLNFIVRHSDDKHLTPLRPGGGKSLLVVMNMNSRGVVRVLAFQ